MPIQPLHPDQLEAVAAWVVDRNRNPQGFCANVNEDAHSTAQGWRDLEPWGASGVLVAGHEGHIRGVMSVEADPEIGRAWLGGPWIEPDSWETVVDRLYAAALDLVPAGTHELELAGDVRNRRLADLAATHGYQERRPHSHFLNLPRGRFAGGLSEPVIPLDAHHLPTLSALHESLFPSPYFTAAQMAQRHGATEHLIVREQGGQLAGYVFVRKEGSIGEIDFLGVSPEMRRRGWGRTLLRDGLVWLFSDSQVRRAGLTVQTDNYRALALYTEMGFAHEREAVGYRRPFTRVAG